MSADMQSKMHASATGGKSKAFQPAGYTPEEAAGAISLLCTPQARLFNGATIALDRGISAGLLTSNMIYLGIQNASGG